MKFNFGKTNTMNSKVVRNRILIVVFVLTVFNSSCKNKTELPSIEEVNKESILYAAFVQNQFLQVYEKRKNSTVTFYVEEQGEKKPIGSGFFITPEGHILSCQHVILSREKLFIRVGDFDSFFPAKLLNENKDLDLALLQVLPNAEGKKPEFGHFTISPTIFPNTGSYYITISSPFGLQASMDSGIIARHMRINVDKYRPQAGFLQLSKPAYQGSSGGVVMNLEGEMIGIIRFSLGYPGGGGENNLIGFAIPVNNVYNFSSDQKDLVTVKKKVSRGIVEIPLMTPFLIKKLNLPTPIGVIISYVEEGSPSEKAGLKRYDFITQINEEPITDAVGFSNVMRKLEDAKTIKIKYFREGKFNEVEVGQDTQAEKQK